ncbi:MAG: stage IV sporulation protein A [Clostridia bacterium]|nr:stage IV sporulation protein A [Clostridia bacterium]
MGEKYEIYQDIARRTGGDIYIGVVGPVRTGKSTFIKRFMEQVVLPQMEEGAKKERAVDEMPQSGSGKNVMTTEPKFVPDEAVRIHLEDGLGFRVKMIDCVGFPIPEAVGSGEDGGVRLVNTPWSEEPLPFDEAARLGTKKVICDHATVGVLVTTDGSIGPIPRDRYLAAESDVIEEMKATGKPFVIVLNTQNPESDETLSLAKLLHEKHGVAVIPANCYLMEEAEFLSILNQIVLEFPICRVALTMPNWILGLEKEHPLRCRILESAIEAFCAIAKTGECFTAIAALEECDLIRKALISESDLGTGKLEIKLLPTERFFWDVLSEKSGMQVSGEEDLMGEFYKLAEMRRKYEKIAVALEEVEASGYGIVTPDPEEMSLEEPEIVKQAGGYGVKLKASAPSIHLIRANIQTEVSPIVGSERQSEDLVKFLLKEFEEDPNKLWQTNMFGKTLYELVNEGLHTKLNHMPDDARQKLGETLQKIINEGSGGLICIIL